MGDKVCPTDILIDLKEDPLPTHMNSTKTITDFSRPDISLIDKENDLRHRYHQSILDGPPFGIYDEYKNFNPDMLDASAFQSLKLKAVADDCPTAILVDIPNVSKLSLRQDCVTNNTHGRQKEKISECKGVVEDLKHKGLKNLDVDFCSEDDRSPKVNGGTNWSPIKRLRWKTPSPQSMSRISKEASKVIHNLNSSALFDDDSLLTEEIFPIPLNFDNFDVEENIKQKDTSDTKTSCEDRILNSSVNMQAEIVVFNTNEMEQANSHSRSPDSRKFPVIVINPAIEARISEINQEDSKEVEENSKELFSSEIHSDSQSISELSISNDGIDDVFIVKQIPSEDKENIQRTEHTILSEVMKSTTPYKRSIKSATKLEFRETLRNVSNITHEISTSTKCLSPNVVKNMNTPQRRKSLFNSKVAESASGKLQKNKIISTMDGVDSSKRIPKSNSLQFNPAKELNSCVQKSHLIMKNASFNSNSLYSSSSSDFKQITAFTKMKTPAKRYSISTPLKSASAMKAPMTPALHSFQKPSIPRYTPQSVGNSRLSFSKSYQPPSGTSLFPKSKGVKQQIHTSTAVSTSASKASSGKLNSFNQRRQSFSQSMSAVSFQALGKDALSTSNKNRFCRKSNLPSPSPISQDRKIARVLFPSTAKK